MTKLSADAIALFDKRESCAELFPCHCERNLKVNAGRDKMSAPEKGQVTEYRSRLKHQEMKVPDQSKYMGSVFNQIDDMSEEIKVRVNTGKLRGRDTYLKLGKISVPV